MRKTKNSHWGTESGACPRWGPRMKIFSINYRGLANTRKKLSLKRILSIQTPEVILLQETMGSELEVENLLTSITPHYTFTAQSARGHLGLLALGWKKYCIRCTNTWGSSFGLGAQLCWEEININLTVINIYGPYSNRSYFWDSFKKSGIIKERKLIIGGDLNFTLGAHEIQGPKAQTYPSSPYFTNLLMC